MQDLGGKVAVVTGAASGIGRALGARFAAEGMKVVLADIDARSLENATGELRSRGADVIGVTADVSRAEDVEVLARSSLDAFGAVHVVCNNAGVASLPAPAWEKSLDEWRWVLGVNLWGVIHGIRAFVPALLRQGEGHIVNTASAAGLLWAPHAAEYLASKHAVVSISESLSLELAACGSAVKVSVLCPAFVRTGILEGAGRRFPGKEWRPEAQAMHAEYRKLMQETGIEPAEVAERVLGAIRDGRFYVLPHPQVKPWARARLEGILSERGPQLSMLSPAWALRTASEDDAEAIARVIVEAFAEQREILDPPSAALEETGATVRGKLSEAAAAVAVENGAIIGCILYRRLEDHVYFQRLAVVPCARRRGVGAALVDFVEARAREWNIRSVRLGVRLALPGQRTYYERLGYRFHSHGFHSGRPEPTFAFLEKSLC